MISMYFDFIDTSIWTLFFRYAREDTHYLLYIYDLMRIRLLALPAESETSDPPLIEASSLISLFGIYVYILRELIWHI